MGRFRIGFSGSFSRSAHSEALIPEENEFGSKAGVES
jgi:hypothetical protein